MTQMISPAAEGPTLVHIASRVLNRPLLLHPTKAEVILEVLRGRLPIDGTTGIAAPDANRFIGGNSRQDGSYRMNSAVDGVALIPIVGSLVNRGAWIGANSGLVSYEGLSAQLRDAANDPEVRSIVLDLDSPGGEATGMFSVAELVRQVSSTKPVVAFVNDMAASAAYGIASAASEIVVSPTSIVGSIGVVLTHMDRSAELEQKGVRATLIYAGKHKVDGNPFGPLSDEVRADLQAEVLKFYDQFVGLVARGRASMSDADVRATEARTFIGQDAIDRGLADRIASLDDVISSLSTKARGAASKRNGFAMSNPTEMAAPQAENAGFTQANLDAARADGMKAGAAAERERIATIMRSEAAEGRAEQAAAFAFDTDMEADAAIKVLSVAPKANAVPSIASRAAAEAEIGSDGSDPAPQPGAAADAAWKKALARLN